MRMKKNLFLLCAFLVPALISAQISSKDAWKQASKLEKSIEKTSFPKRTYNITDFGAKPDMPEAPCHDAIIWLSLHVIRPVGVRSLCPKELSIPVPSR